MNFKKILFGLIILFLLIVECIIYRMPLRFGILVTLFVLLITFLSFILGAMVMGEEPNDTKQKGVPIPIIPSDI